MRSDFVPDLRPGRRSPPRDPQMKVTRQESEAPEGENLAFCHYLSSCARRILFTEISRVVIVR